MENAKIRHELKNKITVIKAYAQVLATKLNNEMVAKIDHQCDELTTLIDRLLPDQFEN